ncbi:hypothetical protein FHG87_007245 [Trinorchestia longiramus]|nr:hypothetical protein FHG87_007245 [Trinorchestia longiramus]
MSSDVVKAKRVRESSKEKDGYSSVKSLEKKNLKVKKHDELLSEAVLHERSHDSEVSNVTRRKRHDEIISELRSLQNGCDNEVAASRKGIFLNKLVVDKFGSGQRLDLKADPLRLMKAIPDVALDDRENLTSASHHGRDERPDFVQQVQVSKFSSDVGSCCDISDTVTEAKMSSKKTAFLDFSAASANMSDTSSDSQLEHDACSKESMSCKNGFTSTCKCAATQEISCENVIPMTSPTRIQNPCLVSMEIVESSNQSCKVNGRRESSFVQDLEIQDHNHENVNSSTYIASTNEFSTPDEHDRWRSVQEQGSEKGNTVSFPQELLRCWSGMWIGLWEFQESLMDFFEERKDRR